jgi:hypothetical protein
MKKLTKASLKKITGGNACRTACRAELNACKIQYAGTPIIELCWDQYFVCLESCV